MRYTDFNIKKTLDFYINELKDNILPFWLDKSIDDRNGGFFNCFENVGDKLISHDKYTWSQGRFVWIWSKLARSDAGIFTDEEKKKFLALAESGIDFLYKHSFTDENKDVCVFLMDEFGNHKLVPGQERFDVGVGADYFVILAFSQYAVAANDEDSYLIAKNLFYSMRERVLAGNSGVIPYPIPWEFESHSYAMSFTNLTTEMLSAAKIFEPADCQEYEKIILECLHITFREFTDEKFVLHEYITDNVLLKESLLARCQKPGHVIEDMWFALDAMKEIGDDRYSANACLVMKKAFENGWDTEYEGILLFCDEAGGKPRGSIQRIEDEGMTKQVLENWSSKVWWVHSETLYAALRFYFETYEDEFLAMYQKTAAVTFDYFPDYKIGEWTQIRDRALKPESRVVALPVKDPYHIIRNYIYIIELLTAEC